MADHDHVSTATFDAGFAFARKLRDPDFRVLLKRLAWTPDQHVIMARDDEPVVDILARMMFHDTRGRALIAIPDRREFHGFRVILVHVPAAGAEPKNPVSLGQGASIGMLCELLRPCGTYSPSDWSKALLFELVSMS